VPLIGRILLHVGAWDRVWAVAGTARKDVAVKEQGPAAPMDAGLVVDCTGATLGT